MSTSEIMDSYLDRIDCGCLEGGSGLEVLNTICRDLGYSRWSGGSSLEEFLKDNSGCIEAIIEWIAQEKNPDWETALSSKGEPANDN
jgi:hypothetical protein